MKRKPVITTVDLLTFYYLPVYNQNGMNKHSIILIYAICKIVDNFMNSDFTSLLNHMVHFMEFTQFLYYFYFLFSSLWTWLHSDFKIEREIYFMIMRSPVLEDVASWTNHIKVKRYFYYRFK